AAHQSRTGPALGILCLSGWAVACQGLSWKGDSPMEQNMPKQPALKSLSVDKLVVLRGQVEAALATKGTEQRRTLQTELGKLSRFSSGKGSGGVRGSRGPVASKYRNPDNPSETWAGRGLKPRWLVAALKSGKKIEELAIGKATKGSSKRTLRKA